MVGCTNRCVDSSLSFHRILKRRETITVLISSIISYQSLVVLASAKHTWQWRRKVSKSGGEGGAHMHVIYIPSVKNQYKRVVFGYSVIY